MNRTELEVRLDAKEDELNCCEAVLDGFAAELPEEPFNNGFDCMGDYITAVVEGFKKKHEEELKKLQADLKKAQEASRRVPKGWSIFTTSKNELVVCAPGADPGMLTIPEGPGGALSLRLLEALGRAILQDRLNTQKG